MGLPLATHASLLGKNKLDRNKCKVQCQPTRIQQPMTYVPREHHGRITKIVNGTWHDVNVKLERHRPSRAHGCGTDLPIPDTTRSCRKGFDNGANVSVFRERLKGSRNGFVAVVRVETSVVNADPRRSLTSLLCVCVYRTGREGVRYDAFE